MHNLIDIQGVPQNMTVARRLESRLKYLNLFATYFNMYDSGNNNYTILPFCAFNITLDIKNIVQVTISK